MDYYAAKLETYLDDWLEILPEAPVLPLKFQLKLSRDLLARVLAHVQLGMPEQRALRDAGFSPDTVARYRKYAASPNHPYSVLLSAFFDCLKKAKELAARERPASWLQIGAEPAEGETITTEVIEIESWEENGRKRKVIRKTKPAPKAKVSSAPDGDSDPKKDPTAILSIIARGIKSIREEQERRAAAAGELDAKPTEGDSAEQDFDPPEDE